MNQTLTREERIEMARARTKQNIDNKDNFGTAGKSVLDYQKIGGWKKELFYQPKAGINHIDLIPFIVNHPKKTTNPHLRPGSPDYLLDLFLHRFVGASKSSFICLQAMFGKPCPICEERERLKNDPNAPEEAYKALFPKRRTIYNVINLDSGNPNQPVQLFEEVHFWFEKPMLEVVSVKNEFDFWDIEFGKSIEFMLTEKKTPKGMSKDYGQFYFSKREPYTEDIYKEAYPLDELLIIPTYEEVRAAMLSIDDEEEPAPAHQSTSQPSSSGRRRGTVETQAPAQERPQEENPFDDSALPFKDEQSPRRERTRSLAPQEENPCPFGHVFGADNEKFTKEGHCTKCDEALWNKCADEHDRLEKEKK